MTKFYSICASKTTYFVGGNWPIYVNIHSSVIRIVILTNNVYGKFFQKKKMCMVNVWYQILYPCNGEVFLGMNLSS